MTIYTGDTIRLVAEFVDFQGNSADPTTVTVRYQDPSGSTTTSTYNTTGWGHPLTGTFTFDVEVSDEGNWKYSFEGTGAVDVYGESGFVVFARGF